jgi:hypothetical protein
MSRYAGAKSPELREVILAESGRYLWKRQYPGP